MAKSEAPAMLKNKDPAILRCICGKSHEHQDSVLGKGMRFCNWRKKKECHSCTVCGKDM